MITGEKREPLKSGGGNSGKYIGFGKIVVKAINPTRQEINTMLGKEGGEEIEYKGVDREGNERLKLAFWMYNESLERWFIHDFYITNKVRTSKDGMKVQYINSSCVLAWTPYTLNPDGTPSGEADLNQLPTWLSNFLGENNEDLGEKEYRQALVGEEELAVFIKAWLGHLKWSKVGSSVTINMKDLFKEDYTELRSFIECGFDAPFVILTGVATDEEDGDKQYQEVWHKGFLPGEFMGYIENKFKIPNAYSKRIWKNFEDKVKDVDYGFRAYHELVAIKEYDRSKDPAASSVARAGVEVTPTNSKF